MILGSRASFILRIALLMISAVIIGYFITLQVHLRWQMFASVSLMIVAVLLARFRPDMRLFLMLLSSVVSLRYLYWRATHTLDFNTLIDASLGFVLFGAELYGIIILLLGYFQTAEELHRRPIPLPSDPESLPWVDVLIPTFNEPEDIVARTAAGAMLMDYPRLRVYILDDGKRPAIQALARKFGCGYLTRGDNRHAKAGNINAALKRTSGDLVAIFDADHVPVRSFLQLTVGFFLNDAQLALVQTPHHFFNPDPFQRNLITYGRVPAEQELFYHVILVGDDFWNSTFFCGSCAVLRRNALQEVGGIAHETVTEDAHTALKLHATGWKSAYLAIPQAAGLATERYAFHVKQRMRWAQGMAQIMRLDNPLLKKGLSLPQRINYFNAMNHFFFGIPRIVYVLAPLAYLLFGRRPVWANPWEVLFYALPHVMLAWVTNSLTFRGFRHSFWAEVYETAIAWQSAVITTKTLFNPRNAKFTVTTKGEGTLTRPEMDWANARPNIMLWLFCILGILAMPIRLYLYPDEASTIFLNGGWVVFNIIILSAAVLVALEQRQLRKTFRIQRVLNGFATLSDGRRVPIRTVNVSDQGCLLRFADIHHRPEIVAVNLIGTHSARVELDAKVVYHRLDGAGTLAGVTFLNISPQQQLALVQLVFSPADSWIDFRSPLDNIVVGFVEVLRTPVRVFGSILRQDKPARSKART